MQPDFVADPGVPPPDHIPDEIIDQYENQARHTVKYRQSRRYRASLRVRKAREPLRDSELWSVTALVFFWAVAGLALTGGIEYEVYLWPRVGLSILGGTLALVGFSLAVALKVTRRS